MDDCYVSTRSPRRPRPGCRHGCPQHRRLHLLQAEIGV